MKTGPTVRRRVEWAARQKALTLAAVTAERTMLELARVALVDRTKVWKDGRLLPFEQWPEENKALLEGMEVVVKNVEGGDGHQDIVHKLHLAKKFPALEALAKHFNLIQDKSSGLTIQAETLLLRLEAGRQRASLPSVVDLGDTQKP